MIFPENAHLIRHLPKGVTIQEKGKLYAYVDIKIPLVKQKTKKNGFTQSDADGDEGGYMEWFAFAPCYQVSG
jgi:hypothetical protein